VRRTVRATLPRGDDKQPLQLRQFPSNEKSQALFRVPIASDRWHLGTFMAGVLARSLGGECMLSSIRVERTSKSSWKYHCPRHLAFVSLNNLREVSHPADQTKPLLKRQLNAEHSGDPTETRACIFQAVRSWKFILASAVS